MKKPFFFPDIPAFIMKVLFGEMADILLQGSRVSSEKIIMAGFSFRYAELEGALRNLLEES